MMKEFKSVKNLSLETVKSKIWKMFDILRSENISSDDYHVLLFLLSAFKDNLISIDLINHNQNLREQLIKQLRNSNKELSNEYALITQSYEPTIKRLSENGLRHLFDALSEINKQNLFENFRDVFDSTLYQISQSQGRYAGEFIQPIELTRFMCGLTDLKKDDKIFNPFAGLASFGTSIDSGVNYFGQELNSKTHALGQLRLMAYQKQVSSRYLCEDSILNWPLRNEKFDVIISNPPFGMRVSHKNNAYGHITIEQFLIENGIPSLKENGKLIALLPQGILFRSTGEKSLREYLVNEDLIEMIISFPGGILLNTGIRFIVLVISREKKLPGKIKLIDGSSFVLSKGARVKAIDDSSLIRFINSNNDDDNIVRIITAEQIRNNDYNLTIERYFKKEFEGVKLGEMLQFVNGTRGNFPERGKIIRIRDLKEDKVDFMLDASSFEETILSRPDLRRISESCLLLAGRWKTLKPTFFEYKGEPIFKSQDILSFKINDAIVDKSYLINELQSDYVIEQIESFRNGGVIPSIRRADLMNVVIKLPSLAEQKSKVKVIYELSDKINRLMEERSALEHGSALNQYSEFASLKHTLGRPRQNILDWSDNLLDFFNKHKDHINSLNKDFSEFYDFDMISALKEIKRDVNFITDVLEKGENGLVLSEYQKEVIPLLSINKIIKELSSNGFNFKIKKNLLKGEKLKEKGIYVNKTLFKTLLNNILTNANKYAFDKKSSANEVVFDLTEVDDSLIMEIKNNGNAFPKNFDREKFITKYSTADSSNGSGLGGYDIHRIATDFNNPDWILSLNEDPFFSVKFKFQFPIKLIN